jgi:hypothetical protein
MISVNGVVQEPDPSGSAGFKLLGSNIVFSSAPANGHAFFGVINAGADYVTAGSEFPDGSATAPSFTFQDDQDTGWFRSGSGAVGYSANGAQTLTFDGNGLTVTGDASFVGDSAKNLLWDKSDGQLEFADNAKAIFGAGSDLSIYHDSNNSAINHNGTGDFYIQSNNNLYIRNFGGDNYIRAIEDGAVELYYDNSKKFETFSAGFRLCNNSAFTMNSDSSSIYFGADDDMQMWHSGSAGYIKNKTGDFYILANNAADNAIRVISNGAVELYNNNVKKLETVSGGIKITSANAGTAGVQIEAPEGQDAYIQFACDDGDDHPDFWRFNNKASDNTFSLENYADSAWEQNIVAKHGGAVELFHDNVKKFDTNAGGAQCYGNLLLGDSSGLYLGDAYDLRISHDGSTNIIDGLYHPIELRHGSEVHIKCIDDGAVELYCNNEKKLKTTSDGIELGADDVHLNIYAENDSGNAMLSLVGKTAAGGVGQAGIVRIVGDSTATANGSSAMYLQTRASNNSINTALTLDAQQNATFAGTVSDSKGDLRKIIKNTKASAYVAVASDAGKCIFISSGGVTINNNVFSDGEAVTIVNNSTSDQTITQGSGLTMHNAADASSGNRTLAGRGMATIWFHEAAECYISGAGLS